MAIGKKRSGQHRVIGQASDSAKAEKKRIAAQLAQKSAQENIAGNRQLDTTRAQAATPGKANAQLTHASLIGAPTPSRLKDRQKHEKAMQTERLAHTSAENKASREHQASENRLQREHSARMQDASLENQRFLSSERINADRAVNRERNDSLERIREIDAKKTAAQNASRLSMEELKGRNTLALEAQKGRDRLALEQQKGMFSAGRDAAKYRHDLEVLGIKAEDELAKWYRQQEFEEQQKIAAENRKYGIPDDADISVEDRAKIINGKGKYEYFYGRTPDEEAQIRAFQEQLANPAADKLDKQVIKHQMEAYMLEHPLRGMAKESSESLMPPRTENIGGVNYMLNNGRWEPVQQPPQGAPTQPQIVTLEDGSRWKGNGKGGFSPYVDANTEMRNKYLESLLRETVTEEQEAGVDKKTVKRNLTPEEIRKRLETFDAVMGGKKPAEPTTKIGVNPQTGLLDVLMNGGTPPNPLAAGGSPVQPPSAAPVVRTDSRGVRWEIVFDQNGKPIGKRPVQHPNQ